MQNLFTGIVLSLIITAQGWAQEVVISGRITDAATGQPLPGAYILYQRGMGTISDQDGYYKVKTGEGNLTLQFRYVGYRSIYRQIAVVAGDTININIRLEPEATQIDQVVISAGRVEQRLAESTVSMSILTPQRYNASHITDSRELITKSPGIEVIDGQAAVRGGSGFSYGAGSRVLTLLDGLPVLAADAGNIRWQFLPMENISQVEIIKGASSVLYGSSALNGVINFRTAQATPEGKTSFFAETSAFGSPRNNNWKWWGSAPRMINTLSFSHLQKYGTTEIGTGLFGTLDQGYRKLNHEHYGRFNINLKHHHQQLEGLVYGVNSLVGYTDKRDFVLWEDAWQGALIQDESTAILMQGTFITLDPFVGYSVDGSYSHDLKMRYQLTDNAFPDATNNESLAQSFLAQYHAWYYINPFISINAGLFQNAARVSSQFYGNHNSLNLAAFAQADLTLTSRLKMVGGLRMEHYSLNSERNDPVVLFRAGMNYMATAFTFLRASFGQGYRYPSIAEKHAATTLGAVKIFPNLLLKPESGWNAEVGIKQGVNSLNWEGMIDVAVFYNQNKDLIEYLFGIYPDPVTGISGPGFRADNTEHSRVYGTETEFIFVRRSNLMETTLSGGYLFTFPVEFNSATGKNTGVYLKYRRKHSAKLSLYTRYGNFEPGVDLYYRSRTLNIDDVFVNEGTREDILPGFYDYWQENNTGYFLADANLGYHFNNTWKISFAVKNFTNTEYMGRPGDIRPHRNFSLRIGATF